MDQEEGGELRAQFHAVVALPFCHPDTVVEAFAALRENTLPLLADMLDLLENYYILGRIRGRGRSPPAFPIRTWNVYDRTLNNQARTNNCSEG